MILKRSCIACSLVCAVLFFLSPHLALAEVEVKELPGNIHLGPVRFHPYFSVKGEYTDNFFLTDTNEDGNWTTILIPGITIQVPVRTHMLQLDYHTEILRHSDFKYYDREDHHASGLLDLKFPWGMELKVSDEYMKSITQPYFEGDTKDTFHYNEGLAEVSYRLANRYKVKVAYFNGIKRFTEQINEVDDFTLHGGSAGLYYRILPKTNILAEYTFYHVDNRDNGLPSTDNDNHHVWAGLEWEPGAKIKGGIKGGYIRREYDEVGKNENSFGMKGDLTYLFSNFTNVRLEAVREIIQTEVTAEEDIFGTHFIRTGGKLSLEHTLTFWVEGTVRMTSTLEGFYYNEDYREKGTVNKRREDDRFGGGVGVNFQYWDRINLGVKYRYTQNNSNFPQATHGDYQENLVSLDFSLVF
jgi:hypothetical protein